MNTMPAKDATQQMLNKMENVRNALKDAVVSVPTLPPEVTAVYMSIKELLDVMVMAEIPPVIMASSVMKLIELIAPNYTSASIKLTNLMINILERGER